MPVPGAQYYALLARALPGTSFYALQWEISRAWGWAMIHASGLLHGEVYIWPDPAKSRVGRAMLKVQEMRDQYRKGAWRPDLDL